MDLLSLMLVGEMGAKMKVWPSVIWIQTHGCKPSGFTTELSRYPIMLSPLSYPTIP